MSSAPAGTFFGIKRIYFSPILREALINSTNEMKCEVHGTQQPGPINLIGEGVSTAQRSNSPVQSINQRFLRPRENLSIN